MDSFQTSFVLYSVTNTQKMEKVEENEFKKEKKSPAAFLDHMQNTLVFEIRREKRDKKYSGSEELK